MTEFNEKFYLQIKGTAMGKWFAPAYANIYLKLNSLHMTLKLTFWTLVPPQFQYTGILDTKVYFKDTDTHAQNKLITLSTLIRV